MEKEMEICSGFGSGELEINDKGLIRIIPGTYCYKSDKAFSDLEDDEIAYISESYLEDFDEDRFYTKEEILEICPECTKAQMLRFCREELKEYGIADEDGTLSLSVAEDIYENAEWACFTTYLDEYDVEENCQVCE